MVDLAPLVEHLAFNLAPLLRSRAELRSRLRLYAAEGKPPVIRIRGDAHVPYEKIIQLMDELKKANLLKFTFDTLPLSK